MKPVILCVDDDVRVLKSLGKVIESSFGNMCRLELAQSGQEALELVEEMLAIKQDIALLITDYSMPGMNGDELVCKLCNRLPLATMALMTGYSDADIIARTVNAGRLDRFISKPWDKSELETIIFDVLRMYVLRKELDKKNTELKLASEMAMVGMVRINYRSNLIQLGDEWFSVFGYDKNMVNVDFNFYESLFSPEDRETLSAIRKSSLSGKAAGSYCHEMRLKDASGNWRYVKRCISAVEFDENGHPIEYLGIDQDLTEQKNKDELLSQAREKSEILDNLAEQVTFLTTDLKVIWTNRIPQGCSTTQKAGYVCYQQWYGLDKPCKGCVVTKAIKEGQKCTTEISRDGRRIDSMIAIPVKNEHGTVIGAVVSQTDITEQKQIEMRLAHAQQMESIGSLAAGIAHEINTPIQYIGDNLTYLAKACQRVRDNCQQLIGCLKQYGNDQALHTLLNNCLASLDMAPDSISDALAGVDHVSRVIAAMKDFSHPSVDNYRVVDINQIVRNAITISRNEWKYVADLHTDFQNDQLQIEAVPNSISQVLLNLIINSAHAVEEKYGRGNKGKISIKTDLEGEFAILEVSDDGCGVKDNIKNRVFDPFFTSKDVGKGTGQGLAIAYDIVVKKHGGSIDFESVEGRGTTFTVKLPVGKKVDNLSVQAASVSA